MIARLLFALTCLICLLPVGTVHADKQGQKNQYIIQNYELNDQMSDGKNINVRIMVGKYSTENPFKDAIWWGVETGKPKIVITGIVVTVGGDRIHVPLSAYCDLADPLDAFIEKTLEGFRLIILGSDAAGSYEALLEFEWGTIKRRKVVLGEFPDEVWEETNYSFIDPNSDR